MDHLLIAFDLSFWTKLVPWFYILLTLLFIVVFFCVVRVELETNKNVKHIKGQMDELLQKLNDQKTKAQVECVSKKETVTIEESEKTEEP